ncbi:hypothetical protein ACFV8T_26975 [Streptomyces sp. NPDC059832]|uniref:hypothetical protein n=1 Tax=unclassified Streptomyces TaxID=2593676 RepID=UPI0036524046
MVAQGAPVTYGMVRAYIATPRAVPPDAPPPSPSARKVTGWLTRHPISLSEEDRAGLKDVLARCPEPDTVAGHIRDFGEIPTDRLNVTLPAGSTPSTPVSCPASPASPSTCTATSTP